MRAAQKGHAESLGKVGYMYYSGAGVAQDYAKAVEWYFKSAENGVDFARHSVGYLYMNGKGVEQNDPKSIYWFRKSVAQGYERLGENLFELLYKGKRGEAAYPDAFRLLNQLLEADPENDEYQYDMARTYWEGRAVIKDGEKAFFRMKKAAANENIDVQYDLSDMYFQGIGTERDSAEGNYRLEIAEENDAVLQLVDLKTTKEINDEKTGYCGDSAFTGAFTYVFTCAL